jgi:ribosome biogenesis protein MAK21
MLSGLLTGVNRTFPFAPIEPEQFEAQMDTLFRVVHIASFNKSVQALLLIFQVMFAQQNVSDRFYRALYSKLLSPEIFHSTRIGLFLNVLFKAMKHDKNPVRVKAFLKRLLQVSLHQQPTFACGALFLVSEILRGSPHLRASLIDHAEPVSEVERRLGKKALGLLEDPSGKPILSAESEESDDETSTPQYVLVLSAALWTFPLTFAFLSAEKRIPQANQRQG